MTGRLTVAQIVIAAAIPVSAGAIVSAWITGSLGALIVVLEGLQQLFQFQQNWTGYRATAEALKHEKYLYLARAGPYADTSREEGLLAERVEGLVSQEQISPPAQGSTKSTLRTSVASPTRVKASIAARMRV